ncbi:protein phosphatase 1 regulatory subunit 35 isoform X2 [Elgaria multicarinata webbii]|uniref:protein phosphatase 1 regulatory subunit 35 isoform X2 n=1 Tax=Elgaria multicarinata webbii TaxID=159646 RepID=UPI002FCCC33A
MAATLHLPHGDDRDSLPCAAPTPLPPPPSQSLSPDPEVALTPERSCTGRAGGGILRRPRQQKLPRRQVRFRLGSIPEELRRSSLDPSREVGKAQSISSSSSPPVAITPKTEPGRGSSGDGWHQSPNMLTTPIPHSTLALGAEVQAVRAQEFDARQAAEELVQRSFVARCAVGARVGEGMNIPRDQQLYQGLVSLHVPEEELLSSAVQEQLLLVRHRTEPRKELDCAGPDLLAFYHPEELFTESPFLEVEGLPALKLQPRTRDPATTFFMYRKLQQWDS